MADSNSWPYASQTISAGINSLVIYLYEKTNTRYRGTEDATHLHVLLSCNTLTYTHKDVSTDEKGNAVTNDTTVTLSITNVNTDRQMYKPGVMTIRMSMTDGSEEVYAKCLKELFLSTECTVDFVTNPGDTDDGYYFALARFYYVKKASLTYENGAAIATLTCYSPDNKLRKDKFCNVYSGKKFAKEIFAGVVSSLKSNSAAVFGSCTDPDNVTSPSYYFNSDDLSFLSYKKEDLMPSVMSDYSADSQTTNTSESSGSSESDSNKETTAELLQPYLVQYNESTYDFLARVANRCGEFMYYDDGVLRVGLPEKTLVALGLKTSTTLTASPTKISPDHTTYPELSFDEDTNITPRLFTENCLDSDNSVSAASGTNYYNAEATDDEQLYPYQPNRDDDQPTEINPLVDETLVVDLFAVMAQGESLKDAAVNVFAQLLGKLMGSISLFGIGLLQVGEMLTAYKNIYGSLSNEDKVTALKDLYNNLCNFFYTELEQLEHEASARTIEMTFGNSTPLIHLGDAVTMDGALDTNYIVTGIKGEYSSSTHNHTVNAVPLLTKATRTGTEQKYATQSDTTTLLAVPPYAVPHTVKGKPQKAIIRDTNDPLTMGRVRITYPWQNAKNIKISDTGTDYAEGYSPWIKMSTPFSGDPENQGGIFMKPALGTHVIVNYFNDNMEDPYVQGSLYVKKHSAPGYKWEYSGLVPQVSDLGNKDEMSAGTPTYAYTPTSQVRTIQSGSGHCITFIDDDKVSFLATHTIPFLYALTMIPDFPADCDSGGMVLQDQSGIYQIAMNAYNRTIDINSPVGKVSINAFTGISISAPNGDVKIVGKNVSIKAGNNLTLQAGANIAQPTDPLSETFGSMLTGFAASLSDKILRASSILGFGNFQRAIDLTFLRATWETFMRPVEGTLSISTPRNITMTAGKGRTVIPSFLLAAHNSEDNSLLTKLSVGSDALELAKEDTSPVVRIAQVLEVAKLAIEEYYNRHVVKYGEIMTHIDKIYDLVNANNGDNDYNKVLCDLFDNDSPDIQEYNERLMDVDTLKPKQTIVNELSGASGLKWQVSGTGFHPLLWNSLREIKNEYNAALHAYRRVFGVSDRDNNAKFISFLNDKLYFCTHIWEKKIALTELTTDVQCTLNVQTELYKDDNTRVGNIHINKANMQTVSQEVFYNIINQMGDYITSNQQNIFELEVGNDNQQRPFINRRLWAGFIDSLVLKPQEKPYEEFDYSTNINKLLTITQAQQAMKLFNWGGCAGSRATSDVTSGGRILISTDEGQTLMTNSDGTALEAVENPTIENIKDFLRHATFNPTDEDVFSDPTNFWNASDLV